MSGFLIESRKKFQVSPFAVLRAPMKKNEMYSYLSGISLIAISVCLLAYPAFSQGGQGAAGQGTVSAVDVPPATPASPSADALVPPPTTGKGAVSAGTSGEFPPQPVSVAPAENANLPTAKPVAAPVTDANVANPVPQGDSGVVNGTNVMGDGGVQQKHSGTYYDSEALVPDSDLAKSGATGPRKVDPAYEPGQKFVVVEKGAKASSFEGQYVAATRALKLGRYAAAMEMFEKLYKKNPRDERVLMGLAVAQQGAGFTESAAKSYEDLLRLQPNNANAIVNLMGIMKDQYPSVTLKKLLELRDKYPSNPGIPALIAMVNS